MEITKEFKQLYLEFFSRVAIVVFAIGIATPFVAGKLTFLLAIISMAAIFLCLFIASIISLTINKKEGIA